MSIARRVPAAGMSLAAGLLVAIAQPGAAHASTAQAAAAPTCNGKATTIVGTPGDDRIRGTAGPDVIVGLGGNDTIRGMGGNDTICGNQGADDLYGGAGNDSLFGGFDQEQPEDPDIDAYWADLLQGGPGNDLIDVGPRSGKHIANLVMLNKATRGVHVNLAKHVAVGEGRDKIIGGGEVAVVGSRHADVIRGGPRRDVLMGFGGNDKIFGGGGSDVIESQFGWARGQGYNGYKPAAPGRSTLVGGPGNDLVSGGPKSTLRGGEGSDTLSEARKIFGGPGRDWFDLRYSGDPAKDPKVLDGGSGRDNLIWQVKGGLGPMETDLRTGRTTLTRSGVSYRIANVEVIDQWISRAPWTVWGTGTSESISGTGPMTVHAGGGDDSVLGSSFDDWVDGGPGTDSFAAGGGSDTCINVEKGWGGCSN